MEFLRDILNDARSKRKEMVTHYTIDDLRAALGFESTAGKRQRIRRPAHNQCLDDPQNATQRWSSGFREHPPRKEMLDARRSLIRPLASPQSRAPTPLGGCIIVRLLVFSSSRTSQIAGCHKDSASELCERLQAAERATHEGPRLRTIVRTVGQPSFIEAYERTSIYPKLTAYIEKWIVDIGDKVKKDQVLATPLRSGTCRGLGHQEGDGRAEREASRSRCLSWSRSPMRT